jgi:uncharacterized membrane protein
MNIYSIGPDLVNGIQVKSHQRNDQQESGYCIRVSIFLQDNNFIRRSFEDRIPQAEMLLQTMMEVRSSQIYPIYVAIHIKEEQI